MPSYGSTWRDSKLKIRRVARSGLIDRRVWANGHLTCAQQAWATMNVVDAGQRSIPVHSRSPDQSSLPALSNMSDVLRRQRLSADSPVTALRFFNDDHGFVSKAFALDCHERIGDLFNYLLLLGVGENPFDHLDVGKWHLKA